MTDSRPAADASWPPADDDPAFVAGLSGRTLWGDDLDASGIAAWYADEAEAYARLGAGDRSSYRYRYHEWNRLHGFDRLPPDARYEHALGFGSAYGDELEPLAGRIGRVTLVDPSEAFDVERIAGAPVTRVAPVPSGDLALADASVDLATCFGVLHHVPNVSHVLAEIGRTLRPGAPLLLREPIVSMGDWRVARRGLTSRERGIPRTLLERAIEAAGLEIEHSAPCGFSLTTRLFKPLVGDAFDSRIAVRADAVLARLFEPNLTYHASSTLRKLRPTSLWVIARRR